MTSGLGGGSDAPVEFELPDGDGSVTVTMRVGIAGMRNGEDWPPIGGSLVVPAHEARDLIRGGLAILAKQPKPATAPVEAAATAAKRTAKRAAKAPTQES